MIEFIKKQISRIERRFDRRFIKKYSYLDDESYIKAFFKRKFHYELDLDNPITFCEKLQWLKLYDRKPLYTQLVDKIAVREYVKEMIGEKYLLSLFGTWDSPEDIDFSKLPDKFVLKCNHNSGTGMCICKDKSKLDIVNVKHKLQLGLKENHYLRGREWPYKNIKPRILCEEYIENPTGEDLADYKFFCFNGVFKILLVCSDRFTNFSIDYYDENLKHLPCADGGYKNRKKPVILPENLKEMIEIAEKLSVGIPEVRVDLYNVNGKIYFGEMTFFDSSGFARFKPREYEKIFGDFICLPEKTVEEKSV